MRYLILPALLCSADQKIKRWIEKQGPGQVNRKIGRGKILIRKSYNQGAMLNFMEQQPELVTKVSLGMTIGLFFYYLFLLGRKGRGLLKIGMAFFLGGALSNVYDRIVRKHVIDYFSFNVTCKKLRDIVFNLGDMFIFIGAFLIACHSIMVPKK